MERKLIKVNGNEYEFINNYWETRSSWGHESWLLINGREEKYNKVRYINRTWENYRFQSCMLGILYELINEREEELKDQFKEQKGISRLTKKYENEFEEFKNNDELLKEYIEVRTQVRGKVW